uniref:Uncharacterized protein n=1 Tax=Romanomermis culicivorax TaxID=13658 RepID=A0A915J025_ROMCU
MQWTQLYRTKEKFSSFDSIEGYDTVRVKRDDASFASNFGGPVAKNVQPPEISEAVTGSGIGPFAKTVLFR